MSLEGGREGSEGRGGEGRGEDWRGGEGRGGRDGWRERGGRERGGRGGREGRDDCYTYYYYGTIDTDQQRRTIFI